MAQSENTGMRRCVDCGYSLDHLEETRCPECGREFDPTDGRTSQPGSDDHKLWVAPCPSEAQAICDRLEQLGIDAVIDRDEVHVNQADADQARQLLKEPVDSFRCPRCPRCTIPMTPGYVWLNRHVGEGWRSRLLWASGVPIQRKLGGYKHDAVACTHMRRAHRCPDCRRVMIEPAEIPEVEHIGHLFHGSDKYAFECLACGQEIPAEESKCPACGWSYAKAEEPGSQE